MAWSGKDSDQDDQQNEYQAHDNSTNNHARLIPVCFVSVPQSTLVEDRSRVVQVHGTNLATTIDKLRFVLDGARVALFSTANVAFGTSDFGDVIDGAWVALLINTNVITRISELVDAGGRAGLVLLGGGACARLSRDWRIWRYDASALEV